MLHPSHYVIAPTATAVKYASAQGRFGVEERLCGYSIASVDEEGRPRAVPEDEFAVLFANAPGGPPTGSIDIANDLDPEGPTRDFVPRSRGTGRRTSTSTGPFACVIWWSARRTRRAGCRTASPSCPATQISAASRRSSSTVEQMHACRSASPRAPIWAERAERRRKPAALLRADQCRAFRCGAARLRRPFRADRTLPHRRAGADARASDARRRPAAQPAGPRRRGRRRRGARGTGLILPEIAPQPDDGDLILVEAGQVTIRTDPSKPPGPEEGRAASSGGVKKCHDIT